MLFFLLFCYEFFPAQFASCARFRHYDFLLVNLINILSQDGLERKYHTTVESDKILNLCALDAIDSSACVIRHTFHI